MYRSGHLLLCTLLCASLVACAVPEQSSKVISQSSDFNLTEQDFSTWLTGRSTDELAFMLHAEKNMLDRVLDVHSNRVLSKVAVEVGLDKDPVIASKLEEARERILISALMAKAAGDVNITDIHELAKERYVANQDSYVTKERRRVAHILLRDRKGCDCANDTPAAEKAVDLRKQLLAGADFAVLAKEHSKDRATAEDGGAMNAWIERNGETIREFENAVFELPAVGEISRTIETNYGLHIIKLLEIEPARQLPFEEVQEQIEQQVLAKTMASAQEQLRSNAYPNPDTVNLDALKKLIELRLSNRKIAAQQDKDS